MRWRVRDPAEWHSTFAWLPKQVDSTAVWLERLERRMVSRYAYGGIIWEYRLGTEGPHTDTPWGKIQPDRGDWSAEREAAGKVFGGKAPPSIRSDGQREG